MNNNKFEIMNTLMRMNKKMAARGPKQGGPQMGRGQMMIVREILENPGISQDQLAEKLSIDKTTVAKSVKKLEAHEMITRVKSIEDSRKYEITATKRAVDIGDRMKNEFDKRTGLLFKGIADEELDSFNITLKKIESNIEMNREELNADRRILSRLISKAVIHNPGITKKELIAQTEINEKRIDKVLIGMQDRGIIEIIDGGIHPTDIAMERQKMMKNRHPGRPGHPGRSGRKRS